MIIRNEIADYHNLNAAKSSIGGQPEKIGGVHKPAFPPVRESDLAIIPEGARTCPQGRGQRSWP
jgi:hypothetical protein